MFSRIYSRNIKAHPGPLMVRGYLNVRATGGAVASSPYRGRPWRGWMLLCFFLRAEESKKFCKVEPCKKGLGGIPRQGETLQKITS